MSSRTAAASTVTPSGLSSLRCSSSTRAVMPTEVATMTAPMNSASVSPKPMSSLKKAMAPAPKTKGRTTPPAATGMLGPA